MSNPKPAFLYRYDNYHDEVFKQIFIVISHTPKGVWIDVHGKKRFVLLSGKKRYAYPTDAEARIGFRKRKLRQLGILLHQVNTTRQALKHLVEEKFNVRSLGFDFFE